MDTKVDVLELSALLQCLGFTVVSLDTVDNNASQDDGVKTSVTIHCKSSGLNLVLENSGAACSCPIERPENSGFWQVCGFTGGKQFDKECGSTILGSMPKLCRDKVSEDLRQIICNIKEHNDCSIDYKEPMVSKKNKSASLLELKSPESGSMRLLTELSPTQYRSLDALTCSKPSDDLPEPGLLTKPITDYDTSADEKKVQMYKRQSTYTVNSLTGSLKQRNKTSSPIKPPTVTNLLSSLLEAEKMADELRNTLSLVVKEIMEAEKEDSSMNSMNSLVLDVSKISVLKNEPARPQYSSSPNIPAMSVKAEENIKSKFRRIESVSTSNLAMKTAQESKPSKLRRLSPSNFKLKIDNSRKASIKSFDTKSKLSNLFKTKIAVPVTPQRHSPSQTSLNSAKKKFSHVKSTIPKPGSAKKE